METRNPDFRLRIAEDVKLPVFSQFFGFQVADCAAGEVALALACRPEFGHRPGWFQGAITTAIAEAAAAFSAATLIPADWQLLTLDQHINFVGAARGERLIARGRVVTAGRTIIHAAADVFAERDGGEHLCATMLQINRCAPARDG